MLQRLPSHSVITVHPSPNTLSIQTAVAAAQADAATSPESTPSHRDFGKTPRGPHQVPVWEETLAQQFFFEKNGGSMPSPSVPGRRRRGGGPAAQGRTPGARATAVATANIDFHA